MSNKKDPMCYLDYDGNVIGLEKHKSDGGSTDYYNIPEGIKDLQGLIEYKNMNFSVGNIFKACYRMGRKEGNDDSYDLRKIIFFAERELKRIENEI